MNGLAYNYDFKLVNTGVGKTIQIYRRSGKFRCFICVAAVQNLNTQNNITFENISYSEYNRLQEYLLPICVQIIAPPLANNREQI